MPSETKPVVTEVDLEIESQGQQVRRKHQERIGQKIDKDEERDPTGENFRIPGMSYNEERTDD